MSERKTCGNCSNCEIVGIAIHPVINTVGGSDHFSTSYGIRTCSVATPERHTTTLPATATNLDGQEIQYEVTGGTNCTIPKEFQPRV